MYPARGFAEGRTHLVQNSKHSQSRLSSLFITQLVISLWMGLTSLTGLANRTRSTVSTVPRMAEHAIAANWGLQNHMRNSRSHSHSAYSCRLTGKSRSSKKRKRGLLDRQKPLLMSGGWPCVKCRSSFYGGFRSINSDPVTQSQRLGISGRLVLLIN